MLRPGWVWAGPMSQSLQGPVSWDTRALTSNQPWREQRPGETWSLTRRALTHRLFLCVCVCVWDWERRSEWDLSFFSSVIFVPPLVPQGQSLNHRVWEGERIERPGDFLPLHSHRWLHCAQMSCPRFGCVYTNRAIIFTLSTVWLVKSFCLTPVHAYPVYVSVSARRVVKCFLCAHDGIRVTAVADYL